jgi:hypothetical protein
MSGQKVPIQRSDKERFRLQFQSGLREYLARHSSASEAFGVVWGKTMEEVRILEAEQAEMYWELVQWARSYDLFTSAGME